ncbi:MAG: NAD-dependent epimerase/dehydratase family protein [Lachnospiraceae bacterium]|nr:NAD-dependent epimerase/dehydratase family protein [Lachnospiraceae bacterium]
MKRVLIAGGSYFIGKAITEKLVNSGYEVTLLNRGNNKVNGVTQLICDRDQKEEMQTVLNGKKFDYLVDVSGMNGMQTEIICNSIDATELKKTIFISSSAVYDVEHLRARFREDDKLKVNKYWGEYGTNKIEAERTFKRFMEQKKIPLTIIRPSYVYGEENYVQRESFIFEHILTNQPVILPDTNKKLQFIYAKDLAMIVKTLLEKETEKTEIYNVGNSEYVTAKEWVLFCAEAMGKRVETVMFDYKKENMGVREFFPFHDYDNVLNVDKIKTICPEETDFLQGLKNAYQWFLKEREHIVWKEQVRKNETEILKLSQL